MLEKCTLPIILQEKGILCGFVCESKQQSCYQHVQEPGIHCV